MAVTGSVACKAYRTCRILLNNLTYSEAALAARECGRDLQRGAGTALVSSAMNHRADAGPIILAVIADVAVGCLQSCVCVSVAVGSEASRPGLRAGCGSQAS